MILIFVNSEVKHRFLFVFKSRIHAIENFCVEKPYLNFCKKHGVNELDITSVLKYVSYKHKAHAYECSVPVAGAAYLLQEFVSEYFMTNKQIQLKADKLNKKNKRKD